MTRLALLFAALTVAFAAPSAASAQGRGRFGDFVPPGHAQPQGPVQRLQEPPRRAEPAREVPLGAVISMIQRRTPGKMLDAGKSYEGGRPILHVRWATDDGRRIDYRIDAETGAILSGG